MTIIKLPTANLDYKIVFRSRRATNSCWVDCDNDLNIEIQPSTDGKMDEIIKVLIIPS